MRSPSVRHQEVNRLDFRDEVERWAGRMGVRPACIRVQPMTKKWASCSSSGWISFSTDLLGEDGAFRELVIVHELLHLQVPNHGKLFKSLLNAYLPGWEGVARGRAGRLCSYQDSSSSP